MTKSVRIALIRFVAGRLPGGHGGETPADKAPIDPGLLPIDLAVVLAPRIGADQNPQRDDEIVMLKAA